MTDEPPVRFATEKVKTRPNREPASVHACCPIDALPRPDVEAGTKIARHTQGGKGQAGYPRLSSRSPNGEKETELSPLGVSVIDHGLSGKRLSRISATPVFTSLTVKNEQ
jgi:hypothetical protein